MAWGKNGSKTLTSAGELTDVTLTANTFLTLMNHNVGLSANNDIDINFNNDTTTNYADRFSRDGGAENTSTSNGSPRIISSGGAFDSFVIGHIINVFSEEKLMIIHGMQSGETGAGTAPSRRNEGVLKWANTSSQITEIDITTTSTATMASDSNVSVIGSEITPAAAVPALGANIQVGSRYEETDTRKMYSLTDPLIADDDFTSYADQTAFDNSWVTSNTAKFRGNPTNDNIDILNSNAYDNIYYDLGSVSDTKWLCKFKVTLTTAGSQALGFCYFYVGSTTGDANESNDGLGFYFYDDANNTYALADNGNRPDQTSVTGALGINPSATTYYAEMKRTSATGFTVTLYSDSSYSTSLGTATLTISSGITGLRYFKIMGYTTSGGLVGTLDDFKFYNNSTDTSKYWQEIGA